MRCVEAVLSEFRGMWPGDLKSYGIPDFVLCRAILDTVCGGSRCADACIIRKLFWTGARNFEDFKGFSVGIVLRD